MNKKYSLTEIKLLAMLKDDLKHAEMLFKKGINYTGKKLTDEERKELADHIQFMNDKICEQIIIVNNLNQTK